MSSRHPSRCDHCAKGWLGGFGMKFVAEPIAWMEISPSSHVSGVGAEAEKSEQEQVYYLTLARDIYKRQLVQKRQDIAELYMKMDALEDALMPFAAAANSPSLDIGSCVKRKAVKHSDCEHALKVLLKLNQKSWIEEAEQSVADDAHLQVQQVPDTPYSL